MEKLKKEIAGTIKKISNLSCFMPMVWSLIRRKSETKKLQMNTSPNAHERLHLARVKELPCSVCDAPGPSEAHHIRQSSAWTCVALCPDCHRGAINGWHGQKSMWRIEKMDELDALSVTISRLR